MRPQKITLGEMRIGRGGVRGVLVYCADYRCGHHITLAAETVDQWPGDVRLSDLEPKFICQKCGQRGAEVRPDFNWTAKGPIGGMGYR
jgi:hypothetical protein